MFNPFKNKKEEVLDLRKDKIDRGEIPVPSEVKQRLKQEVKEKEVSQDSGGYESYGSKDTVDLSADTKQEEKTESSGGGFFSNFFGGGDSESNNTVSSSEADSVTQIPSTTYGSSSRVSNSTQEKVQTLLERVSKLTDRIELLERKIERIERR